MSELVCQGHFIAAHAFRLFSLCEKVEALQYWSTHTHTHVRPHSQQELFSQFISVGLSFHFSDLFTSLQQHLFFDTSLIYNRAFCNPSHFNTLCLSAIVNNQLQRWILLLQTLLNMIPASRMRICFKYNQKERDIESMSKHTYQSPTIQFSRRELQSN